jgi:hypothetical protein
MQVPELQRHFADWEITGALELRFVTGTSTQPFNPFVPPGPARYYHSNAGLDSMMGRSATVRWGIRRQSVGARMTSNQRRWLHYGLAFAAIISSLFSLFALVEMNAPSWTTRLNILSVVLILLVVRTRGQGPSADGG